MGLCLSPAPSVGWEIKQEGQCACLACREHAVQGHPHSPQASRPARGARSMGGAGGGSLGAPQGGGLGADSLGAGAGLACGSQPQLGESGDTSRRGAFPPLPRRSPPARPEPRTEPLPP